MLSVKGSVSLLPACQLISSYLEWLLLRFTEITVQRDFIPQHAGITSDFLICSVSVGQVLFHLRDSGVCGLSVTGAWIGFGPQSEALAFVRCTLNVPST